MSNVCTINDGHADYGRRSTTLPNSLDARTLGSRGGSKITIVVESKRVHTDVRTIVYPSSMPFVGSFPNSRRVYVQENVLDDKQQQMVDEARSIAFTLGVALEVKDVAKQSILSRVFKSIFSSRSRAPTVTFPPWALDLIQDGIFVHHHGFTPPAITDLTEKIHQKHSLPHENPPVV